MIPTCPGRLISWGPPSRTTGARTARSLFLLAFVSGTLIGLASAAEIHSVTDSSPLGEKAAFLQQDLVTKHSEDGLYVSIVPHLPGGTRLEHTVNEPGNIIHSGVWTGRYLAGVGYQYAVTKDPQVRAMGGQILKALRILQEVTGKPGLLARGYMKGHGPVAEYEREGNNSVKWHQGQGQYANYRWYSDVSVDNFNAVLYGYGVYYDLAADDEQKRFIAKDVDRLMSNLLDNHCRIIDLDGEPTEWGRIGRDPDAPQGQTDRVRTNRPAGSKGTRRGGRNSLRAELMLLPDLLIAYHVTGKDRYLNTYRRAIERFKPDPNEDADRRPRTPERLARRNHSAEGQAYEALYRAIRYEKDPALLAVYRKWVRDLWEVGWNDHNPIFTYMSMALLPDGRVAGPGTAGSPPPADVPHAAEALEQAKDTLALYPVDRVMHPVMNSIRKDIEINPFKDRNGNRQAVKPIPINQLRLDNEYAWKGNPCELDGWIKPTVTVIQFSCDDPQVAWFRDSAGGAYETLDHGRTWKSITTSLAGAAIRNLVASKERTFVLWAECDKGIYVTRDGGLSWRMIPSEESPRFPKYKFGKWLPVTDSISVRINNKTSLLERSTDGGKTSATAMKGWRIPLARSVFRTPWGVIASGPGGVYRSDDADSWTEMTFWRKTKPERPTIFTPIGWVAITVLFRPTVEKADHRQEVSR